MVEIEASLKGWNAPQVHLRTTNSTQDIARKMAEDGAPEWTIVTSDRQTAGRGRMGRTWTSTQGGLYLSIILRPAIAPGKLLELNRLAAETIARVLTSISGLQTTIKPPNDVLAAPKNKKTTELGDFKKICGILLEASGDTRRTQWAVLGIGVNVNNSIPRSLPDAASLRQLAGCDFDIPNICKELLLQLRKNYHGRGTL